MKTIFAVCLLSVGIIACSTQPARNGQVEKARAKAIWDSIRPSLLRLDSTTGGYIYSSMNTDGTLGDLTPSIEFELDSLDGPQNVKLHINFGKHSVPESYAYMGQHLIITDGHLNRFSSHTTYEDSIGVIVRAGINELIAGGGVRLGTNRGATLKITPGDRAALQRGIMATEALKTLYSSN